MRDYQFGISLILIAGVAWSVPRPCCGQAPARREQKPKETSRRGKPPITTDAPAPQPKDVPIAEIARGPLPAGLEGATAWVWKSNSEPQEADGRLAFHVDVAGPTYLAMSYDADGDPLGFWDAEVTTADAMLSRPWIPVGVISLAVPENGPPSRHLLFYQEIRGRQEVRFRTRKFTPPVLIRAAEGAKTPDVAEMEADAGLPERLQESIPGRRLLALLAAERYDELEAWTKRYLAGSERNEFGRSKYEILTRVVSIRSWMLSSPDDFEAIQPKSDRWLKKYPDSVAAKATAVAITAARASLLSQWGNPAPHAALIEELNRRAVELNFELEQAHPELAEPYRAAFKLGRTEKWPVDLIDGYVDRAIDSDSWCAEGLVNAFRAYGITFTGDSLDAYARLIDGFFAKFERIKNQADRDALFAYVAMETRWVGWQNANGYPVDRERVARGFEELLRRYPKSLRTKMQYCRFACLVGDRAKAVRLFAELGDFRAGEYDVFDSEANLRSHRTWAALDTVAPGGDKRPAVYSWTGAEAYAVQWEPDGRHVIVGDRSANYWRLDTETGGRELWLTPWRGRVVRSTSAFRITPDGKRVVVASTGPYVGIARLEEREARKRWYYSPDSPRTQTTAVAVSQDNARLLRARIARDVGLFDISGDAGRQAAILGAEWKPGRGSIICFLSFLAPQETRYLAVGMDGKAALRDLKTHAVLDSWQAHDVPGFVAAAVTADRKLLATCSEDRRVRLWRLPEGELVGDLVVGERRRFDALTFSDDGRLLAFGESNGDIGASEIQVWDVAARKKIASFAGHQGSITALDFSDDGRQLLSAGLDLTIRRWSLSGVATER